MKNLKETIRFGMSGHDGKAEGSIASGTDSDATSEFLYS